VVLVPLDIVQDKYRAVSQRQLRDAAFEIYPVTRPLQGQIGCRDIDARRAGFIIWIGSRFKRDRWQGLLAKPALARR